MHLTNSTQHPASLLEKEGKTFRFASFFFSSPPLRYLRQRACQNEQKPQLRLRTTFSLVRCRKWALRFPPPNLSHSARRRRGRCAKIPKADDEISNFFICLTLCPGLIECYSVKLRFTVTWLACLAFSDPTHPEPINAPQIKRGKTFVSRLVEDWAISSSIWSVAVCSQFLWWKTILADQTALWWL